MIDDLGVAFCETCGLDLDDDRCPNCDPTRPVSQAGERARSGSLAERARAGGVRRAERVAGAPRWLRPVLRFFYWLTVEP